MTWMKHVEHGGIANLPDLPYWRAQGWEPTDERPPEPNTLKDPAPEPEETTEPPETPGVLAAEPTTTPKAKMTEEKIDG